jgi:hypothetical protein
MPSFGMSLPHLLPAHLEGAHLVKEKRHMQPQVEAEQERWQGLLARAEAQSAQVEQEVLKARFWRQRMDQEAIQQRSERTHLEQKLTAVRAERMWHKVERAVKQDGKERMKAMLCKTCLDNPKDDILSCGHQACGDCAELSKCYLCHQLARD